MGTVWNHMYDGFILGVYATILECVEAASYFGGECYLAVAA